MLFCVQKPLLRLHPTTLRLFSLFQAHQQRGKKWKSKNWGLFGDGEQRADRYEKRLKRRAGNRELKFLLNLDGTFTLPTVRQFEEKVKHSTKGKGLFSKTSSRSAEAQGDQANSSEGFFQPGFRSNSYHRSKRRTEWRREKAERDPWGYEAPTGQRNDRDSFWNFFRVSWETSGGGRRDDNAAWHSFGGSRTRSTSRNAYEETFAYTPPNAQDQIAKGHLGILGMSSAVGLTSVQLKKAFLKCAVLWHPDKHTGNERTRAKAEERFKQAQTSYAYLQKHFSL